MSADRTQPAVVVERTTTVRGAMRAPLITCQPDDTLASLAMTLIREGIHAIVVETKPKAAPLIVRDLDLIRAAVGRPRAATDVRARDLSPEAVVTLSGDASLDELIAVMSEWDAEHVLATDPDTGEICGIVSSLDVVAVLAGEDPERVRELSPGLTRPPPTGRGLEATRASEVMGPGVVTCTPDTPIWLVARCMAEHRVHCIAIAGVDGGRHDHHYSWGLVNAQELVRASHRHALTEPAGSIARTAPAAVATGDSLAVVAALMVEDAATHVVVVDESGLPCGMISTLDLASVLANVV